MDTLLSDMRKAQNATQSQLTTTGFNKHRYPSMATSVY
jgi:hypothetical protein